MAIKVNQSKQYRIYIKGSKSWVDVNKEFYTNYYRDINAYDEIADEIFRLRELRQKTTVDTAARDEQIKRINDLQD